MTDALADDLAQLTTATARAQFFRRRPELLRPAVVDDLYGRVVRLARSDLRQAGHLALAARWLADRLDDDASRAQALRAEGHVRFMRGEYTGALERYNGAARVFQRAGRDVDLARTLNGSLQSLISLGRYTQAHAAARRARKLFERHRVALGLARLDSNVANILCRQDRFDEALPMYQRSYEQLLNIGEPQDVAAALSNLALCHINVNDFERALTTYGRARAYCDRHGMPLLVAQADYNIAYLHYLRGEYTRALELYAAAREHSERIGDRYHGALCDLDRSEIYLELNLKQEARELAGRARVRFGELRMLYEEAKALTTLAQAVSDHDGVRHARMLFGRARRLFARERNDVWRALVDYYEAQVLYRGGEHAEARQLAVRARRLARRVSTPVRAASCELLLARLDLDAHRVKAAETASRAIARYAAAADTPMIAYQSQFLLGLAREARDDAPGALAAFKSAQRSVEELRSRLVGDSLKVAFLEDKQALYESLVLASMRRTRTSADMKTTFGYIEQAKSRNLADLIAFRVASLSPRGGAGHEVTELRQRLNWLYRQVDQAESRPKDRSASRARALRERVGELERRLSRALQDVRRTDEEFSTLQTGASFGIDEIRGSLGGDAMLLEYYQARGQIYVAILGSKTVDIVPLGPMAAVSNQLRLLQFQLSKFRLGPEYVTSLGAQLQVAAQTHLRQLYDALIAPIRDRLRAPHLVVVPHGVLHALPFHALFDGRRYLVDEFSVSYAPSGTVYNLCCTKPAAPNAGALVLGVPDALAPSIADEAQAVAGALPDPHVFIGSAATSEQLRRHGAASRFVHIATHGHFRRDNPMFSSIRLGDGPFSVYDVYELQLPAELVTLSGCSTGATVIAGGDEQLGLVRGLLYAGARAVLLTLWDVHDSSTSEFMTTFYGRLQNGWSRARAAQQGMRELRDRYAHPFYWAPFCVIGDARRILA
jgi:tetratricopeptide (TPR) repeat protein